MTTPRPASDPWFLFYRRALSPRAEVTFAHGTERITAEFNTKRRGWDLLITGTLLGSPFSLEASSRRRLDGDTIDSHLPLFVGNFKHEDGACGEFTARPRDDGELLTLGVYGAAQSIRMCKIAPNASVCPVEVYGIRGVRLRFEEAPFTANHLFSAKAIPKPPGQFHYAGVAIVETKLNGTRPPMAAVLTALLLCYKEIVTEYYVKDSGP
jgi:hypothetical protein